MEKIFLDDVKANGSWEMQFMNEMYPDKCLEYKKEKICKNRKKIEDNNVKDGDIIIRAYAMWLKMKIYHIIDKKDFDKFLKKNDKLFYKIEYFGCDWFPRKWNLNRANEFTKSVIEIEQKEKDDFFDNIEKEQKKIKKESIIDKLPVDKPKKEKIKIKIKKKKDSVQNCQENNMDEKISAMKQERDNLLKQLNQLQEKTDNLGNIKDVYKEDYKIVKKELDILYAKMEKQGWTKDMLKEFDMKKEFYQKYSDRQEELDDKFKKLKSKQNK